MGEPRSILDRAKELNINTNKKDLAAVNKAFFGIKNNVTLGHHERLQLTQIHSEALEFLRPLIFTKVRNVARNVVTGALARAHYNLPKPKI